ncbi:glycosyltransferase family 69 protein [Xylariomycetidae sp. FL2044]|nr:glycosyltransferase family 69 protein [Xylariomycetidae sp. FL2044]
MSRRRWRLVGPCLALATLALYSYRSLILQNKDPPLLLGDPSTDLYGQAVNGPPAVPDLPAQPGSHVTKYVKSILDPSDTRLPRLQCPELKGSRYDYLKSTSSASPAARYFFALNLRECLSLLPRLLGSLVEAIRFLGPENCAVSIVEGNSADGTEEVLSALLPELEKLLPRGRVRFVLGSPVNPLEDPRFGKLAELRNMALAPLLEDPGAYHADDATVVFINDVAICLEDILELVHQRRALGADMTCAFDWICGDDGGCIFYDSYVARAINGDLFFDIPAATTSFALAGNLFWNEPRARARFERRRPFQVFSCWNGAVAFSAAPLVRGQVAFRPSKQNEGECHQGEPELFCKDMWFHGYGKIAVVPSISLEYSDEKGKLVKGLKGFTSQWTGAHTHGTEEEEEEEGIEWQMPPAEVKCMPTFDNQSWRPWNETLA